MRCSPAARPPLLPLRPRLPSHGASRQAAAPPPVPPSARERARPSAGTARRPWRRAGCAAAHTCAEAHRHVCGGHQHAHAYTRACRTMALYSRRVGCAWEHAHGAYSRGDHVHRHGQHGHGHGHGQHRQHGQVYVESTSRAPLPSQRVSLPSPLRPRPPHSLHPRVPRTELPRAAPPPPPALRLHGAACDASVAIHAPGVEVSHDGGRGACRARGADETRRSSSRLISSRLWPGLVKAHTATWGAHQGV